MIRRLHRREDATALTEFLITLPFFIMIFVGIINLGLLGRYGTGAQMQASAQMWDTVIPLTRYTGGNQYMTIGGAGHAAVEHGIVASKLKGRDIVAHGAEAAIMTGVTIGGHWGESFMRAGPMKPFQNDKELDDVTFKPDKIMGEQPYPLFAMSDQLGRTSFNTNSALSIVAELITRSGGVLALGAGYRYGSVFGKVDTMKIHVIGGLEAESFAYYDVAIPPAAMSSGEALVSFALHRLLAETEDNYKVMMNFGKSEWDGDSSGWDGRDDMFGDMDDAWDELEREREEREKELEEALKEEGN